MNDKIKDRLGRVLMAGIIMLSIAALWYAGSYAKTTDVNYSRSFAVTGEGKVVAVPDIARFSFSVVTEGGKDLATLQQENVKKANAAIDFLKAQGVDKKDISTQAFSINPRYQNSYCGPTIYGASSTCPPATIVGYTVTQTVAVKVRNLDKAGDLLSGVIARGANTTSGPSFDVDNPTKLESEARAQAIAQAREKAEAVAKAGKFRLGRLISVEEGVMPYYAYGKGGGDSRMMEMAPHAAPVTPTIEAGSQDVTINVTLRYEID